MTGTATTETTLTTRHYEAASSFGGAVRNAPWARCTAGRKVCKCNSLETVCPDIAADFDVRKNGVTAAEVTSSASSKYSWLSDEPGAKKRSVDQRTHYTRHKLKNDARHLQ